MTYNEQKQLVKKTEKKSYSSFWEADVEEIIVTYAYDDNGNVIKQRIDYPSNRAVITKFTYEFDTKSNWTTKNTYVNDILTYVTTREITYWE